MKNKLKLFGIIALAAVIGLTFVTCDNGGNNGGNGIDDWTYSVYGDYEYGGTSTISMTRGNGDDNDKLTITGVIRHTTPVGYTGWRAIPNEGNLTKLKNTNSFSFKCKGDGKKYMVQVLIGDVKDFCQYQFVFETSKIEKTIIVNYLDLEQPTWGIQVDFNKNNIKQIDFQATEHYTGEGEYNISIWDIKADEQFD